MLDQDSGIVNRRSCSASGSSTAPIPWLSSPDVALIAVIMVNIWIGIPFNVTLLYSGLQDIPDELYEAGALDGATGWKAFWHITWPNLRAVVSVVLMLGVIYTLKVLDIILGLTDGGPANATQTIATQSYQRSFVEFKFGEGAALSNILILISLVFAIIYLRATRAPGRRVRSCDMSASAHNTHARRVSAPRSPSCCSRSCCSRSTGCSTPRCQPSGNTLIANFFPTDPESRRLRGAPSPIRASNLVTSLMIAVRHGGAHPVDRRAGGVRAGAVPVPLGRRSRCCRS